MLCRAALLIVISLPPILYLSPVCRVCTLRNAVCRSASMHTYSLSLSFPCCGRARGEIIKNFFDASRITTHLQIYIQIILIQKISQLPNSPEHVPPPCPPLRPSHIEWHNGRLEWLVYAWPLPVINVANPLRPTPMSLTSSERAGSFSLPVARIVRSPILPLYKAMGMEVGIRSGWTLHDVTSP